jgi:hypothetical protein
MLVAHDDSPSMVASDGKPFMVLDVGSRDRAAGGSGVKDVVTDESERLADRERDACVQIEVHDGR